MDFVGQNKILGGRSIISSFIKSKRLNNLVLWGPPGSGKTSLALLLGKEFEAEFISLNATEIGAKVLRELGESSRLRSRLDARPTIVFVDEIHRLNKSQQDVLLPFIEQGDFTLIGATTENPSYELNRALLSRCHLLVFEPLQQEDLMKIWLRASEYFRWPIDQIETKALHRLIELADGDARRFINMIEICALHIEGNQGQILLDDELNKILPQQLLGYDKNGDNHYDLASALIKSIRGSDPDAALYYLARMLEGGEDPGFIARRLVILASEDIGNADPRALQVAVSGAEAVQIIGMPECGINLAHVVTYLASAPKSNRSYTGWLRAKEFVNKTRSIPVPLHLRSARTSEMTKIGYGVGYKYPHDWPNAWVEQDYFPTDISGPKFYEPSDRGFEKNIRDYAIWLKQRKKNDPVPS
jgi:putative ATPase